MRIFRVLPLAVLAAGWAAQVQAQDVWAYEVIAPDNSSRVYFRPPFDLTYPPPGVPAPSLANTPVDSNVAIRVAPQEVAQRLRGPTLRIIALPAGTAVNIRSMPLP